MLCHVVACSADMRVLLAKPLLRLRQGLLVVLLGILMLFLQPVNCISLQDYMILWSLRMHFAHCKAGFPKLMVHLCIAIHWLEGDLKGASMFAVMHSMRGSSEVQPCLIAW